MSLLMRIESALEHALLNGCGPACPPRLVAAVRHAVFPGGARIRPQLCLAVAMACGDEDPELANAAAVAIELLHCASLVHDDLPCFDDADVRRGQPTVHKAWGERLAVLGGDALIVMAFDVIGRAGGVNPRRMAKVLAAVAAGVGMPSGIVAGQAWECEPRADLRDYQRAKTGALFTAATMCGALSCGAPAEPWRAFGDSLGEAYQVADDIRDVAGDPAWLGKPVGQDAEHHRPSRAAELGLDGAVRYFEELVRRAQAAVPDCEGAGMLRHLVRQESLRLVPQELVPDIVRAVA
ncbi:MAG: polyprenyl synthetase family protein [Betaproteobacteria bacterium]|nr:polyprenyl synthetase family protein [Betaproteobacteria bacterium]NBT11379.1 polyprenyl synthetase family protein [Betaproteobacteria bacterium]NBU50477.1 polyprenyl synthetase family protein [Betaproteobacteria bacterium]NBX96405.1 polyprenyl synthetase family protein [Betaproteobacteria bacterium]